MTPALFRLWPPAFGTACSSPLELERLGGLSPPGAGIRSKATPPQKNCNIAARSGPCPAVRSPSWQPLVSQSTPSRSHRAASTPSTHISCFSSLQRLQPPTPPAPPSSHCSGGHTQHLGKATATKRRPLSVWVWKEKSDLWWPQRYTLGLNPEQIGTGRGAHTALAISVEASL